MSHFKYLLIVSIVIVLTSCRSAKSLTTAATIKENTSAKQIIRENQRQMADFKTLQAKVKIDYTEGDKSQGFTLSLRMEKDKAIWLNASFNVIRIMITPEKVSYYNKLENEYFDGDYSLLSDLLGIELNFDKVQNILMGETLFDLSKGTYLASNNGVSYILQPENQDALFEILYLFNPGYYKLDSQQLAQAKEKRFLQVDYKVYQTVGKVIIPEVVNIVAVEDNSEIKIDLEYKSVSLNDDVRFPFEIPSGYKEIELK